MTKSSSGSSGSNSKNRLSAIQTPLIYLFPGQGGATTNWARKLYNTNTVFKALIRDCVTKFTAALNKKGMAVDLLNEIYPDQKPAQETSQKNYLYMPIKLFIVEYALVKFLESKGITPDVVLGHSDGEYAAAVTAGIMSLGDAIKLIVARTELVNKEKTTLGRMIAVRTTIEIIKNELSLAKSPIDIAAINSKNEVVLSGNVNDIDNFCNKLSAKEITFTPLLCQHAFHSSSMQSISKKFEEVSAQITYSHPKVKFISTLTGELLGDATSINAGYWNAHISQTVNFQKAMSSLQDCHHAHFVDLGMDNVLSRLGKQCLQTSNFTWKALFSSSEQGEVNSSTINSLTLLKKQHTQQMIKLPQRIVSQYKPIAVVGYACRLPGANTPEDFWKLLINKESGLSKIPPERYHLYRYGNVSEQLLPEGGYLDNVDQFDADFFKINAREAALMDPQQRLLLELTWEAFEHAGLSVKKLRQQQVRTGVCTGVSTYDFTQMLANVKMTSPYVPTGNAGSGSSGRISMFLGLEGPSLTIDSACSSALTAMQTMIHYLQSGGCDLAVVGTSNLVLSQALNVSLKKAGMLAPDAACKVFDRDANGYARSEGGGAVVLMPLEAARKKGLTIHGVILGASVSQDGKRIGLTVPNAKAQKRLFNLALQRAGVTADQIQYIETHGTGTSLGDPIEMHAINGIYSSESRQKPLLIGSVKSNIGHTEASAGMAGLLKILLSMQHNRIPPNIHFNHLNPKIRLKNIPANIVLEPSPWLEGSTKIASLHAFGFTGTIVNMILSSYEKGLPNKFSSKNERTVSQRPYHLFLLSAKSNASLLESVEKYKLFLQQKTDKDLANICYTSAVGRDHFDRRIALPVKSISDLKAKLTSINKKQAFATKQVKRIIFLFSGQGSQYLRMGAELYNTQKVYHDVFLACIQKFQKTLQEKKITVDLLALIFSKDSNDKRIDQTLYTQIFLFANQYALTLLWQSWGITPETVIGHSIGEFCAAVIAEIMSLDDAIKLVTTRGLLMQSLPEDGAMVAVKLSQEAVATYISKFQKVNSDAIIQIAAINNTDQIVVSGQNGGINKFLSYLKNQTVTTKKLNVSRAFHSALMTPMLRLFYQEALKVHYKLPSINFISTMDASDKASVLFDANYWKKQIVNPVRFYDAIKKVNAGDDVAFIEIGPNPVLLGMISSMFPDSHPIFLSSMRKNISDTLSIFRSVSKLHIGSTAINWEVFEQSFDAKTRVPMPTYSFQRKRHWPEELDAPVAFDPETHPLLGTKLQLASPDAPVVFRAVINARWPYFVKEHKVYNVSVIPGAGYLSSVVFAAKRLFPDTKTVTFEKAEFLEPAVVNKAQCINLRTVFSSENTDEPGIMSFKVLGCKAFYVDDKSIWTLHAKGTFSTSKDKAAQNKLSLTEIKECFKLSIDVKQVYQYLSKVGISYGESFKLLDEIYVADNELLGKFKAPINDREKRFDLSPGLIDTFFQLSSGLFYNNASLQDAPFVPVQLSNFSYGYEGHPTWAHIKRLPSDERSIINMSISLYSSHGDKLGEFEKLVLKRAPKSVLFRSIKAGEVDTGLAYKTVWVPQAKPEEVVSSLVEQQPTQKDNAWLIFRLDTNASFAEQLCQQLGLADQHRFIEPSKRFSSVGNITKLNPENTLDFEKLIDSYSKNASLNVVFMWSYQKIPANIQDETIKSALQLSARAALYLVQALDKKLTINNQRLFFLTEQSQAYHLEAENSLPVNLVQSVLHGLCRTIILEYPKLFCQHLDVMSNVDEKVKAIQIAKAVTSSSAAESLAVLRKTGWFVPRLTAHKSADSFMLPFVEHYQVMIDRASKVKGLKALDNIYMDQLQKRPALDSDEVSVAVKYTSLNFRDVLNLLGYYPGEAGNVGLDFSGIIQEIGNKVSDFKVGDAVFGLTQHGTLKNLTTASSRVIAHKPESVNFPIAASLPVVFLTAYMCLKNIAKLQSKERVLIHAASGGVGSMAIQVAQHCGATIFATAGSKAKRQFLVEEYGLNPDYILDSRSTDYGYEILKLTDGKGVNVILNSLTGPGFIEANLRACAKDARFVEIGKINIWSIEKIAAARSDVFYRIFDLREDALLSKTREVLEVGAKMLVDGSMKSPHLSVWPIENIIAASKYMAKAKHTGKVVLHLTKPLFFTDQATYLITGGLGGIGFKLCERLLDYGQCHIVLVGRHAPSSHLAQRIAAINKKGVRVHVINADISNENQVRKLLSSGIETLAPLRGIFHAAGVLSDKLIPQQRWTDFQHVFAPKLWGAWYLHKHALDLNIALNAFVLFSSFTSANGSPGQSNYAAANAFLDGLTHYRRALGLPAHSVNWGAWAEVGMAVKHIDFRKLKHIGMTPMPPNVALDAFETAIKNPYPQLLIADVKWPKLANVQPGMKTWLSKLTAGHAQQKVDSDLLNQLKACQSDAQQKEQLEGYLLRLLNAIFGDSGQNKFTANQSFNDLGMDSLSMQEMRLKLDQDLGAGVDFQASTFVHYSTVSALAGYILSELPNVRISSSSHAGKSDLAVALPSYWHTWFFANLLPKQNAHHCLFVVDIKKNTFVNIGLLRTSLLILASEQPALRTAVTLSAQGALTYQQVDEAVVDFSSVISKADTAFEDLLQENYALLTKKQVDISKPLSLKAVFLKAGDQQKLIVLSHRLIFDTFSSEIFVTAFSRIYQALLNKESYTPKNRIETYTKHLTDLKGRSQSAYYGAKLSYWADRLSTLPRMMDLPTDYPRVSLQDRSIVSAEITVNQVLVKKLHTFSQQHSVPMQLLTLSVFYLALASMTKQPHLVVGVPVSNRKKSTDSGDDLLGLFEDIYPFSMSVNSSNTWHDFVTNIQTLYLQGMQNIGVDFFDVVEKLNIAMDFSHHPIFQVVFSASHKQQVSQDLFSLNPILHHSGVGADLSMQLHYSDTSIMGTLNYNKHLFKPSTMHAFLTVFRDCLNSVMTSSPETTLEVMLALPKSLHVSNGMLHYNGYSIDSDAVKSLIKQVKSVKDVLITVDHSSPKPELIAYIDIGAADNVYISELLAALKKSLGDLNVGLKGLTPFLHQAVTQASDLDSTASVEVLLQDMIGSRFTIKTKDKLKLLKTLVDILKNELSEEAQASLQKKVHAQISFSALRSATNAASTDSAMETAIVVAGYANLLVKAKRQSILDKVYASLSNIPGYSTPSKLVLLNALPSAKELTLKNLLAASEEQAVKYRAQQIPIAGRATLGAVESNKALENLHELLLDSYITPKKVLLRRLVKIASDILGRNFSEPHEDLFHGAMTLPQVLSFHLMVKHLFNLNIPVIDLLRYKTLNNLSSSVISKLSFNPLKGVDPLLVIHKPNAANKNLFLIHPATGVSYAYISIKPYVKGMAVYGIHNPHLGELEHCYKSIEAMAADYILIIRKVQPQGPYNLGGWSFGGMVAFEMAKQLQRMGQPVSSLILIDTFSPQFAKGAAWAGSGDQPGLLSMLGIFAIGGVDKRIQFELWHNVLLIGAYDPTPYKGRVILLKSQDASSNAFSKAWQIVDNGWNALVNPPVDVVTVPGDHYGVFYKEAANSTAKCLNRLITDTSATPILQKTDLGLLDRYLLCAAERNDYVFIGHLLQQHRDSININSQDFLGRTALHLAVKNNNVEMVKAIVELDADLMITDHLGFTAVNLLSQKPNADISLILESAKVKQYALMDDSKQSTQKKGRKSLLSLRGLFKHSELAVDDEQKPSSSTSNNFGGLSF